MAGGVALNCVANGRLLREGPFENIWIQPAAGDAGGALGAALLVWHRDLNQPRQPQLPDAQSGSLLGPAFSNDDIGLFLDSMGATYERLADEDVLLERVARLMASEKVDRMVPGSNGVRSARPGLPQHHRRRALAAHAAENERQHQVPGIVPSVCALRPS